MESQTCGVSILVTHHNDEVKRHRIPALANPIATQKNTIQTIENSTETKGRSGR